MDLLSTQLVNLGFVRGWKLTLVILSLSPVLFVLSFAFTKVTEVLLGNPVKLRVFERFGRLDCGENVQE